MEAITIVLVLLFAVVASGFASRLLPLPIPLPLVQVLLGAAIGLAVDWRVTLDPAIFFLLLLPPLLFLDGWRIPPEKIRKDVGAILGLALGLVVFTVLGAGLFIHWLIPVMPLSVAFALAAVISPTDPIAVSAVAQRVPIPERMMHILEGESLLNDASGLVCLRFAVAATLTSSFSLPGAALNFLWLAFGGLAIGAGLTWAVGKTKGWITRELGEDSSSQILISLLIPYGAYLLAERLHCSGILAAVAAGLAMGFVESGGQALATTRLRRNTVWDVIQFTVNGVIFVLLGEQLPMILASAGGTVRLAGHQSAWWLMLYVLTITLGLALLRLAWVYLSLRFTLFRRNGAPSTPNWRVVGVMSFAGVKGAITLAGVLTIPLALADGSPFPARNLAIFLASGVIVTSLVVASIALPWLLADLRMPPEPSRQVEEDAARIGAAQAAIAEIDRTQRDIPEGCSDPDLHIAAAARVMASYRQRIDDQKGNAAANPSTQRAEKIERDLRLAALKAERAELFRMVRKRKLASDLARKLVRELDLQESAINSDQFSHRADSGRG